MRYIKVFIFIIYISLNLSFYVPIENYFLPKIPDYFNIENCKDKKLLKNNNKLLTECILYVENKKNFLNLNLCDLNLNSWENKFCLCKKNFFKNNLNKAEELCLESLEKKPLNDIVNLELGKIYLDNGKYQKALEIFSTAWQINNENEKALLFLAFTYQKKEDFSLAEKSFKILLSKTKKNDYERISYLKKMLKNINILKEKKNKKLINTKSEKCLYDYENATNKEKKYLIGENCFKYLNKNISFLNDYSQLCFNLSKNEECINTIKNLINQSKNNEILSNAYSLLAQININLGYDNKAIDNFKKAYSYGLNDNTSLKKYAELLELNEHYDTALEINKKIYEKEPSDYIKEKIDNLNDMTFPDMFIIDELFKRGMIDSKTNILTNDQKKLFLNIRRSERNGAVNYIKSKYFGYAGLYFEDLEGKDFKLKLTNKGYFLYLRDISQKSIKFYEEKGISLNNVFKLRTIKGEPIYDNKGYLTEEGFSSYLIASSSNKKNWLMPDEIIPLNTSKENKKEEDNEEIKRLKKIGYEEILLDEYDWLRIATDCPEDILLNNPCNLKKIKINKKLRYFICSKEGLCSKDSLILFTYINRYRNGDTSTPLQKKGTAFFGSGANISRKFCYKNKIWDGLE